MKIYHKQFKKVDWYKVCEVKPQKRGKVLSCLDKVTEFFCFNYDDCEWSDSFDVN